MEAKVENVEEVNGGGRDYEEAENRGVIGRDKRGREDGRDRSRSRGDGRDGS